MSSYPNLLVDGDMEQAGTSLWGNALGSIEKDASKKRSGVQSLKINGNSYVYPSGVAAWWGGMVIPAGYIVRIKGHISGDGVSGFCRISGITTGGVDVVLWQSTTATDWQPFDVTYQAGSVFYIQTLGVGNVWVDDVEVTIERKNRLHDGWCERTDTVAWGVYAATLSKSTTSPHSLSRDLQVTATGASSNIVVWPMYDYGGVFVVGRNYRVNGSLRAESAATILRVFRANAGGWYSYPADMLWESSGSSAWQQCSTAFVAQAPSAGFFVVGVNAAANHIMHLDDFECFDLSAAKSWQRKNGIWRR